MKKLKKQALKLAVEQGEEILSGDLHYRNATLKIENAGSFDALEHIMMLMILSACSVGIIQLAKKYSEKLSVDTRSMLAEPSS